ncbi:MAG: DNA-binding protein [Opitutia bacterium]|nr:ORF6N domain-containing protein [Opitutaceae bacterium]PHX86757.1 MAG: DNA-binding protein [Opitutae bacterium]
MAKKAPDSVLPKIDAVRRKKVVLDADLARLYGVPTNRLNEAVRRNAARFPEDFSFIVTRDEPLNLRSQFATPSSGHGGGRIMPRVFTEHGALMAANVLRSERAVQMSLYLIRAFVVLREQLVANLSTLRRLSEIDKKLLEDEAVLREVLERLQPLLNPPPAPKKLLIGFHPGNR